MESKRLELIAFIVLFAGLSVLTFLVFQPFLSVLVLAAVLSVLFHPLYEKMLKIFAGKRSFVAYILVVVALVFIILPLLFFGLQIIGQAQNFFSLAQNNQGQFLQSIQTHADQLVQYFIPGFSIDIAGSVNKTLAFVSDNLGGVLSQTTIIFFQIFFTLFAFFFFLRDGEEMLDSIYALSPFEKSQNEKIVGSVHRTITSVIRGTLFVGLIRFGLLAAAFYLFGIPGAILWACIGGIIGAVPGLGTPFVIIPAFIFLWIYSNIFMALGMGLFGILLFFFIDNLLSTYFFSKGIQIQPFFILFSILGGVIYFGPLGFIFGPIILSMFISAVEMYQILVLKKN